MLKKVFALILTLFLIMFTTCVFAANNVGDSMMDARNTVRNAVGGAENVVEDAAVDIGAGVRNLGNTFADGASRVTNDGMNNQNDGYTATRTATPRTAAGNNGTVMGMSANTWTWLILAIAAILIVGLVWYYAMQNKNEYDETNH